MPDLLVPPAELAIPPAYAWVPEHTSTAAAQEAADLAADIGLELDPEQRYALDVLLAERSERWASLEAAIIAPRQNLKTFLFKVIALHELYIVGSRLLVWTAHEFNTAMEAFRDVRELIDGADWLRRRVKSVIEANGKEGIEFHSGQRIRFKARTKTGGRGLSGDVTFLDEAFALQPNHVGSLLPTMAARSKRGNPRIYYGSSAGQLQSSVLRRLRDRGRPGGDPSLTYLEWCIPEGGCAEENCTHLYGTVEGCVLDDIEQIRKAHTAFERRISIEFVQAMRRTLPTEEFAREFAGWWEDPIAGTSGIPIDAWDECAARDAELLEPCTIAVDVAPGQTSGAVVACGGTLHVVEHGRGTDWIVPTVQGILAGGDDKPAKKVAAVGLDPMGPAAALISEFEQAKFIVRGAKNPKGLLVLLDGRESVQACEQFLAGVLARSLVHRDQQSLNAAVASAGRRVVGDSWKWSRRDSTVDISPLVAATVARFLWTTPRPRDLPAATSSSGPATGPGEDFFRPTGRLDI